MRYCMGQFVGGWSIVKRNDHDINKWRKVYHEGVSNKG